MNNMKEQFNKSSHESIETTSQVLKASLASIEQLTKLNLENSKKFLEETTQALKEVTAVPIPQDLFGKINTLTNHTVRHNMSNLHDVYDIIANTHNKIHKMLEAYIENSQKNIAIIADFSKSNSGNKSMLPAHSIKKWIEYTNKAIENFNKNTALASSSMLNSSVTKPDPIKTKT